MTKQRTARQWASLIRTYESSGLTQAAFCRRHHIALSTLSYHLRKHRAGQHAAPAPHDQPGPACAPSLIELSLPSPAPGAATGGMTSRGEIRIDVNLPGGPATSIHCHSTQAGEILAQLANLQPISA